MRAQVAFTFTYAGANEGAYGSANACAFGVPNRESVCGTNERAHPEPHARVQLWLQSR